MRFAYPYILLLLIPVAYSAWFALRKQRATASFIAYPSTTLMHAFPRHSVLYRERVLAFMRCGILALLVFALARPQAGQKSEEVLTKGYDIMLCIDTSSTMKAEDFKPHNRLYVAKKVAEEFVKERPHDRIGLVVFSGIAFTQCPLTLDHGALLDFLKHVDIGMTQTDGTAIGNAIITSVNRLMKSDGKSKIIILTTDGRNNMGEIDPITAAKAAEAVGVKIYAIGTGVPGEAMFPIDHPIFGRQYVKIPEELDETTLTDIALATGGRYFRATSQEALEEIYSRINSMEKSDIKVKEYTQYSELFRWFLLPAVFLMLLELLLRYLVWKRIP